MHGGVKEFVFCGRVEFPYGAEARSLYLLSPPGICMDWDEESVPLQRAPAQIYIFTLYPGPKFTHEQIYL